MGSKIRLISIAVVALVGAVVATTVIRDMRRGKNLSEGERLLQTHQLDDALAVYEELFEADPRDPEAILGLCEIDRRRGAYGRARQRLEPFVNKVTPDPRYLEAAGWIYLADQDAEQATTLFRQMQTRDQTYAGHAALGLGAASLSATRGKTSAHLEEAEIQLNQAARLLRGDGRVALWQSRLHLAQGYPKRALEAANRCIDELKPPGDGYLARGQAQLELGKVDEAAADFTQALQEGGEPLATKRSLAQASYLRGEIDRALAELSELPLHDDIQSDDVRMEIARLSILLGKLEDAKQALQAMQPNRGKPIGQLLLVEVLARLGESERALEAAAKLRRRISTFAPASLEEARLLMQLDRSEEARYALQAAFEAAPNLPGPTEGLGTHYLVAGQARNAVDYLDAIADQDSGTASAIHNCVLAYLLSDNQSSAINRLNQLPIQGVLQGLVRWTMGEVDTALQVTLAADPKEDWRQGWLAAEILLRNGRPQEALERLAVTTPPESAQWTIDLLQAIGLAATGKVDEAEKRFRTLADEERIEDAKADACVLGLAYCAWRKNETDEASELWTSLDESRRPYRDEGALNATWLDTLENTSLTSKASPSAKKRPGPQWLRLLIGTENHPTPQQIEVFLTDYPHHGPALVQSARLLAESGEIDAAVEKIETAIVVSPNRASLYRFLAVLQWRKQDIDSARKSLQKATHLSDDKGSTAGDLALLALHEGNMKRVESEVQALRAKDRSEEANRLEGLALASRGLWEKAEAPLQAALERLPADVEVLIASGVCAAQLGRTADAEVLLQDAIRLAPSRGDCHGLLGQLYATRGLYTEAYQSLQTALLLNPDQSEAKRLSERIEQWMERGEL